MSDSSQAQQSRSAPAESVRPKRLLFVFLAACIAYALGYLLPEAASEFETVLRCRALAATVLITGTWLTSALPLGVASLLPLVLFPFFGLQSTADVAKSYSHPILWLFAGGFVLALALTRWGLHQRMALMVIARMGPRPRWLVLGFVLAGLFISMWISNTATSLMLLPIGWALVERVRDGGLLTPDQSRRFGICVMLAIAYGCSVGGMATPIGTAPNALYLSVWDDLQPDAGGIAFSTWLLAFGPYALLLGVLVWATLVFVVHRLPARVNLDAAKSLIEDARNLPPLSTPQRRVLGLFVLAVVLWVTRADLSFGEQFTMPGWARLIVPEGSGSNYLADGTVAVGIAILAFMIPAGGALPSTTIEDAMDRGADGRREQPTPEQQVTSEPERLMDWHSIRDLPLNVLFLLGAGIAIAETFRTSGLSVALGTLAAPAIASLSPFLVLVLIGLLVTFLTEVSSNTAITSVMLPILFASATEIGIDPRFVMLPATIAASCAFMFPIATPPNAIVFSSGHVSWGEMARAGIVLNLAAVFLFAVWFWFAAMPILGITHVGD